MSWRRSVGIARTPVGMRNLLGLLCLMAFTLSGCAAPTITTSVPRASLSPGQIVEGCCDRAGPYPDWVLRLADAHSDMLRRVGLIQLRPGRIQNHPAALARLLAALRPMDVLFFHSENRVSGLLIPGHFTHAAIYIGSEADLREAGLWALPALRPWQEAITGGAMFLEAVDGGVRLSRSEFVLDTDAVVALRPLTRDRAHSLARGLEQIGTGFDMRFDAGEPSALFCAELIELVQPAAPLPRTRVLGRETIVIDAIVARALSGDLPYALVGYLAASPGGGLRILSARDLAWDIRLQWPDHQP